MLISGVSGIPGSWQTVAISVGLIVGGYVAALWLAAVYWTVRDARQRLSNPLLEIGAGGLVLVFFVPGLWLYLILRPGLTLAERYERSLEAEAVLSELADQANCPQCAKRVRDDYLLCPTCKYRLKEPCGGCSRPLSFAWVACPFCGADNQSREEAATVLALPVARHNRRSRAGGAKGASAQPQAQLSGTSGGN